MILSRSTAVWSRNAETLLDENYNLAYTQLKRIKIFLKVVVKELFYYILIIKIDLLLDFKNILMVF